MFWLQDSTELLEDNTATQVTLISGHTSFARLFAVVPWRRSARLENSTLFSISTSDFNSFSYYNFMFARWRCCLLLQQECSISEVGRE